MSKFRIFSNEEEAKNFCNLYLSRNLLAKVEFMSPVMVDGKLQYRWIVWHE